MRQCVVIIVLLAWVPHPSPALAEPAPEPQILEGLGELVGALWTPADEKAQIRTMADCRNLGNALMAWVTDELSAASAGADTFDVEVYPLSSYEEMKEHLVPRYIQELPRTDGWGHPYEFRVAWDDPLSRHVIFVRSPGKDGEFSGSTYEKGAFDPDDMDQDIIWADGFFVRWPERQPAY